MSFKQNEGLQSHQRAFDDETLRYRQFVFFLFKPAYIGHCVSMFIVI